jgi:hypothetical protein
VRWLSARPRFSRDRQAIADAPPIHDKAVASLIEPRWLRPCVAGRLTREEGYGPCESGLFSDLPIEIEPDPESLAR